MKVGISRRRMLWAAATDHTFERRIDRQRVVLWGACIHCRRHLTLSHDGTPISRATLEHIVPRNHGGTQHRDNLAVACAGCNAAKGHRLDCRRIDDPDLRRVVERLQERRRTRLRPPPPDWDLPPPPPGWHDAR